MINGHEDMILTPMSYLVFKDFFFIKVHPDMTPLLMRKIVPKATAVDVTYIIFSLTDPFFLRVIGTICIKTEVDSLECSRKKGYGATTLTREF